MLTGNKQTDLATLIHLAEHEERSAAALRVIGRLAQADLCDRAAVRFRAQARELGR